MTDTQPEIWWRKWDWIILRAVVPCSVGMLGGVLAMGGRDTPYTIAPTAGLIVAFFLATASLYHVPRRDRAALSTIFWLRWQSMALGMALAASAFCYVAHRLNGGRDGVLASGMVGVFTGLVAILAGNLSDLGIKDLARQGYALIILPWLAAFELGVLSGWLLVYGSTIAKVSAAHQRVLSVVILTVMLELLVLLRGYIMPRPSYMSRSLNMWGAKQTFTSLFGLRAWGGSLVPTLLLILTMTNEGIWLAALAWLILLLGHMAWYYMLMAASPQARQRI